MQHNDPIFIDDPHAPEGVPPMFGLRWYGHRRLVHRQRARKLRAKGVKLQVVAPGVWAWYESELSYQTREMLRVLKAGARKPLYWNHDGIVMVRKAFETVLKANYTEVEKIVNAFYASVAIEAATGSELDALCRIPIRPAGMTDEDMRNLYTRGHVLKVDKPLGMLDELNKQAAEHMRASPAATLYYMDESYKLPNEGWPALETLHLHVEQPIDSRFPDYGTMTPQEAADKYGLPNYDLMPMGTREPKP